MISDEQHYSEQCYTEPLTERQQEILDLLVQGRSTKYLADHLFISPATVRNHIQDIMGRLGAHSRLEAVAIYNRSRLDPVDPAGPVLALCKQSGMDLTGRQRSAIRDTFLPTTMSVPAQPGAPAIENITVTMSSQQRL